MFKKCMHSWEKVSEQTLPSPFEQAVKAGKPKSFTLDPSFYKKTYILILKCTFCGKLDKTVVASKILMD